MCATKESKVSLDLWLHMILIYVSTIPRQVLKGKKGRKLSPRTFCKSTSQVPSNLTEISTKVICQITFSSTETVWEIPWEDKSLTTSLSNSRRSLLMSTVYKEQMIKKLHKSLLSLWIREFAKDSLRRLAKAFWTHHLVLMSIKASLSNLRLSMENSTSSSFLTMWLKEQWNPLTSMWLRIPLRFLRTRYLTLRMLYATTTTIGPTQLRFQHPACWPIR